MKFVNDPKQSDKNRKMISWHPEAAERVRRLQEKTLNFLQHGAGAVPWFRGLSLRQMEACDKLQSAIRDDMRQETTFRISSCVHDLGVLPMVGDSQLKQLRDMSRGNDIAFLWFLMEYFYRSKQKPGAETTYSLNEQLIMSGIAHLDMIPTWRELDQILPPAQPTKKEIIKRRKDAERKKQLEEKARIIAKRRAATKRKEKEAGKVVSPYLQKLVRFKEIVRNYNNTKPALPLRFKLYEQWENPYYKVPNENTHWYQDYKFDPSKRIATKIIYDQLEHVVKTGTAPRNTRFAETLRRLSGRRISLNNDSQNDHSLPFFDRAYLNDTNAATDEEIVKKRQECLDYLDVQKQSKEKVRKRVLKQLNDDVHKYTQAMAKSTPEPNRRALVLHIRGVKDYSYVDVDTQSCLPCERGLHDHNSEPCRHCAPPRCGPVVKSGKSVPFKGLFGQVGVGDGAHNYVMRLPAGACRCECEKPNGQETRQKKQIKRKKKRSPAKPKEANKSEEHNVVPEHKQELKVEKEARKFFQAPTPRMPYRFNYDEIFNLGDLRVPSSKKRKDESSVGSSKFRPINVKAIMKQALLDDPNGQGSTSIELGGAAAACANKMTSQFFEQAHHQTIATASTSWFRSKYNKDYYDPEDDELIQEMLKDAFAVMSENKKFILATFPEVHKLEVLRNWVAGRFGKTYTVKECLEAFNHSRKMFDTKYKQPQKVRNSSQLDAGKDWQTYISYNLHLYLMKKAKSIKNMYWKRYFAATLDYVRQLWFVCRPYICPSGPPRELFFAYLPASRRDLTHYKVWNPKDFKDYVAIRRDAKMSTN